MRTTEELTAFVTGATGNLGSIGLARILETTPWRIIAPVRAAHDDAAAARLDRILDYTLLGPAAAMRGRVNAIAADLSQDRLGLTEGQWRGVRDRLAGGIIIHFAGSVRFDAPLSELHAANVIGTRHVLDLAAEVPDLRRVVHVGTAYSAGKQGGRVFETPHGRVEPRGPYEETKHAAEQDLIRTGASLPYTITRPAIVGGSQDIGPGFTTAFSVFYPLLELFADERLPFLIANPRGLLDIVPVDWVADAIIRLATAPAAEGKIVHLAAGNAALTIGQFVELAAERLRVRAPEIIAPAEGTVDELIERGRIPAGQRGLLRWMLKHWGDYTTVATTFDTEVRTALLGESGRTSAPAPLERIFDALVGYALATDWGTVAVSRRDWTRDRQPWLLERG